ncbi:MAG: hypothetical protein LBI27_00625 [Clostridiales bacterium]|jgi:hypothetical protein|nr:hypothetical protein [Clostridiales bacterium]
MENKKTRKQKNLEIERSKRKKQKIFTAVLAGCIAALVFVLGYTVWDIQDRRNIMTFQGTSIATGDFRYFYDFMESGRNEAMRELQKTLVVLEHGVQNGIELTSDELSDASQNAADMRDFMSQMGMNYISERRIAEFSSVENVANRLMDMFVPELEIVADEEAMEAFIEENMEDIMAGSNDMNLKYIASATYNDVYDAFSTLRNSGETFDELIEEFHIFYDPEVGIETIELWEFLETVTQWQHYGELLALEEPGDFTEVLELDGMYFIAQLHELAFSQERFEENVEYMRSMYSGNLETEELNRRQEVFSEMIDEWINEANFIINNRAFNRFETE